MMHENIDSKIRKNVVQKYHVPRAVVVIPHFNYSEFIGEALLSVQQQTYQNFTCVIVDDCSDDAHFEVVRSEVASLADNRFELVRQDRNMGMVHAIYRGLEESTASFLSVLDPDDRYAPNFLERMITLHLNPYVFCSLVSCDQHLLKIGDGIVTSTQYTNGTDRILTRETEVEAETFQNFAFHRFFAPTERGWHWSTTSALMFRTDAMRFFKPIKQFSYKGQGDSYYANGAHMLGGTLLLREPLIYRGLHTRNDYISSSIVSMWQKQERAGAVHLSDEVKVDVVEAFFANGGMRAFDLQNIREVILSQFRGEHFVRLLRAIPELPSLLFDSET